MALQVSNRAKNAVVSFCNCVANMYFIHSDACKAQYIIIRTTSCVKIHFIVQQKTRIICRASFHKSSSVDHVETETLSSFTCCTELQKVRTLLNFQVTPTDYAQWQLFFYADR